MPFAFSYLGARVVRRAWLGARVVRRAERGEAATSGVLEPVLCDVGAPPLAFEPNAKDRYQEPGQAPDGLPHRVADFQSPARSDLMVRAPRVPVSRVRAAKQRSARGRGSRGASDRRERPKLVLGRGQAGLTTRAPTRFHSVSPRSSKPRGSLAVFHTALFPQTRGLLWLLVPRPVVSSLIDILRFAKHTNPHRTRHSKRHLLATYQRLTAIPASLFHVKHSCFLSRSKSCLSPFRALISS